MKFFSECECPLIHIFHNTTLKKDSSPFTPSKVIAQKGSHLSAFKMRQSRGFNTCNVHVQ